MLERLTLTIFAAALLSGCAKQFMATAPAPSDAFVYVVGSHAGQAAAWVCPAVPNGKECVEVTVHEQDR